MSAVPQSSLDQAFLTARTFTVWQDKPIAPEVLRKIYDIAKFGPTASNLCPLRIRFIQSPEAKERLKPALAEGNVSKAMSAPVVAILATDEEFYKNWKTLAPHKDWETVFESMPASARSVVALRNSSLQAAYFMIVARMLGLDCGPMSGFDNAQVDAEFFAGTSIKSNFLCNLGYGDPTKLYPRGPRLDFDQACEVL